MDGEYTKMVTLRSEFFVDFTRRAPEASKAAGAPLSADAVAGTASSDAAATTTAAARTRARPTVEFLM